MDSVIAGIIVILLFLTAGLTLTTTFFEAQRDIQDAWQQAEVRIDNRSRTNLMPISAKTQSNGSVAQLVYRNTGTARLTDFDEWDIIIQYTDSSDPAGYHVDWLPQADGVIENNEWRMVGIYLSAETMAPEVYEPEILNPGEEVLIEVQIDPTLGYGRTLLAFLAVGNGVGAPLMVTRNIPPELTVNAGLTLTSRTDANINNMMLAATDADDPVASLVFEVTTATTQGDLSLGTTFTQMQIDEGLLEYTHTGDGDDSFAFTVTDGEDLIGIYTFTITVTNADPELLNNTGINIAPGGIVTITNPMLAAGDMDNTASELTYFIVTGPSQGTLTPSGMFTQQDINDGLVSYQHTGTGSDSFTFNISDGEATIGPFVFQFQLP
jgi:archaellum component FlaF (FlaF/FlaG flagellin family)